MKTQEEILQELKETFFERHPNTLNENVTNEDYITPEQFKTEWKNIIREIYEAITNERKSQLTSSNEHFE